MISQAVVEGFKFGFSLKRLLPCIFLNLLFLYTMCNMFGIIGTMEVRGEVVTSVTPLLGLYFLVSLFYWISQPILISTILHQFKTLRRKVSLKKSFKFSFSIFLKTFTIYVILFITVFLLASIPLIWPGAILLFLMASLYVYPAAVLDGKRVRESFKMSFKIFYKHPFKTFIVFLLVLLFSLVATLVSFGPMFLWLGASLHSYKLQTGIDDIVILSNYLGMLLLSPVIIPLLLLPAIVMSFVFVVKLAVAAKLYLNLKKDV